MAKKTPKDFSTYLTVFILTIVIFAAITAGLTARLKHPSTKVSPSNTSTLDVDMLDDSTPLWLQSDKGVLFIAALDKKTLKINDVSIDYLIGNAEPERIEEKPLLTIESFDLYKNPINEQPLPTSDNSEEGSRTLDYWVISTELGLPMRAVYWQIRHVPSNKVIWETNVHTFLLNQSLEMMPASHFVSDKSKNRIKDQIQQLENIYSEADENNIINELSDLKQLVLVETEENALKTEPLQVDQEDFLEILHNLLSSIETRNIE